MIELCYEDDWYVREIPRWVVELNDGTTVYQDDGRPGREPSSAWVRLGMSCRETGRFIVDMRLQFRSNIFPMEPGRAGYYFGKVAFGVWGGGSYEGFLAGWLDGDGVEIRHVKVPELMLLRAERRRVDLCRRNLIIRDVLG